MVGESTGAKASTLGTRGGKGQTRCKGGAGGSPSVIRLVRRVVVEEQGTLQQQKNTGTPIGECQL